MSLELWRDVEYEAAVPGEHAASLRAAFADIYANGDVILARFVPRKPSAFKRAACAPFVSWELTLDAFLRAIAGQVALCELELGSCHPWPPVHRSVGSYELEGAVTQALVSGGVGSTVPEERARQLARAYLDECLMDRRSSGVGFIIYGAWTSWFRDVAWDVTFLVYDPQGQAWTCLFATDSD